ncbi:hypothetical protein [Aeromicrobium sp. UC242_57]|uniref:hypothetical protein n=1 Tax=Aeromicrobium sp. UC242_57 TaxID=3374624 RepID=UPI0037A36221
MRTRTITHGLTAALASLALLTSAVQADAASSNRYYANQTPYGDPASTPVLSPPDGYQLFFLETVARHGARSQTDTAAEKRVLSVWKKASKKRALTSRGKRFDNDLRAFQKAERTIGYGHLSTIGKAEWRGIGRRTADNYGQFLSKLRGSR